MLMVHKKIESFNSIEVDLYPTGLINQGPEWTTTGDPISKSSPEDPGLKVLIDGRYSKYHLIDFSDNFAVFFFS